VQSSRVEKGDGGQGEVAVPLLQMIELKDGEVLVDDEPKVPEQLTEHPQNSSPTGRMAAYHSDIEGVRRSQAFIEVMQQVDRVSSTDLPVLLIGESGTVKELIASAIHHSSSRRDQPFVAVNCGSMSAELLETELFGQAGSGTLFLDQITETSSSFQQKLFDILQTGRVDVRVIAGSNRNVEEEVTAGKFRSDLFSPLSAATIVLPPLCDEPEPKPLINEDWVPLSEIEGRYVARVLEHTHGNKQAAARVLSVDRKTLDRMIKRHHIIPQHTRGQRAKVFRSA
jgi:transcriptional regulator with GAF, ATPase, and Fis domain